MRRVVFPSALAAFFLCAALHAQTPRRVAFLGIASPDADANMIQMTENLYLAQLGEVSGITVSDRRGNNFAENYLASGTPDFSNADAPLAFYAVISRGTGDTWSCVTNIADTATGETHSATRTYDSYYKILMESKQTLQSIFSELLEPSQTASAQTAETPAQTPSQTAERVSTERLAGTWTGEQYVDKIVIMRGGRGFVIYKNGATMNIAVSVSNDVVTVTQTGNANASFFPELEREAALKAATTAKPITWSLTLLNGDTLVGTKETLVEENGDTLQEAVPVTWTRM